MEPTRIALIGFMGSGKSVIGAGLATALGVTHHDTDMILELRHGTSVRDLFANKGEAWFRMEEAEILVSVCCDENVIISTGGGIVLKPENRRVLRDRCCTVWLTASVETLLERLGTEAESRPLLQTGDLHAHILRMLGERAPLYQEAAHIVVDTSAREPAAIVREIIRKTEKWGRHL